VIKEECLGAESKYAFQLLSGRTGLNSGNCNYRFSSKSLTQIKALITADIAVTTSSEMSALTSAQIAVMSTAKSALSLQTL
jgi:hypothetical protein